MWFKKRELTESEKRQRFCSYVLASVNKIPADRWREVVTENPHRHKDVDYHATTENGAFVVIKQASDEDYNNSYELTVDGELIAYYRTTGCSYYSGDKDIGTLHQNIAQAVRRWNAKKNRPERKVQEAKSQSEFKKRAEEEEKKRQSMLRRL